jgi:hypothetical protein
MEAIALVVILVVAFTAFSFLSDRSQGFADPNTMKSLEVPNLMLSLPRVAASTS